MKFAHTALPSQVHGMHPRGLPHRARPNRYRCANTLIATVTALTHAGNIPPVCIAVHPLFVGDAMAGLHAAGAGPIVGGDTVVHPSNAISITTPMSQAILQTDQRRSAHP